MAAVRAVWDAIEAADLAADWETNQSHMTSDFVHLDPRTEPIRGAGAWREWVESMEFGSAEGGYVVEEVAGSGDLAYVMWAFDATWTEASEPVEARGKGMTLFRRQADGSWLMSRNVWNETPS
ncbi:MAG: SnoaL-like domain-containing protein [Gemmatimonadetes bacterium]|nr:SnoaL-like domain-containing protein [Gemmatimonadota bacterium]